MANKREKNQQRASGGVFGTTIRMTQAQLTDYLCMPATTDKKTCPCNSNIRYRLIVDPVDLQIRTIHLPERGKPYFV